MLYLVFGKDTYRSRKKLKELEDFFIKKNSRLGVYKVSADEFSSSDFEEFWRANNLFGNKNLVIGEGLFGDKVVADFLLKNLEKISSSENIFIFWEEELAESTLSSLKTAAEKIQKFEPLSRKDLERWLSEKARERGFELAPSERAELVEKCGSDLWCLDGEVEKRSLAAVGSQNKERVFKRQGKEEVNLFHLCDAFAQKNKRQLWLLFQRALLLGASAEEIFWKLWWQTKNLLLLKNLSPGRTAKSGLHPFVEKKTRAFLKNFKEKELAAYSARLVEIYNESKIGGDLEILLEDFILGME